MVKPLRFQVTILPVERILPFEQVDVMPIEAEADSPVTVVRNPLLVMPLEGGNYLLLDEAPRLARLLAEGITQVPAQVCRRSQLHVVMESLALFGIQPEHIDEIVARSDSAIVKLAEHQAVPTGYQPVVIDFQTGLQIALGVSEGENQGCPSGLLRLLKEIDAIGRFAPHLSEWYKVDPLVRCAQSDAVLFPPRLVLEDIARAAVEGALLPANLVRISAEDRILAIDFPLSVLRSTMPIEQKSDFLHDLISLRRQANRTSIVQGRVYILNL